MCSYLFGTCCNETGSNCTEEAVYGQAWARSGYPDPAYTTVPQDLADSFALSCQQAVRWFHDKEHVFLGVPSVRRIPDEEVVERIAGYQAELHREWSRVVQSTPDILEYKLAELPFPRQRALCERWEQLWDEWLNNNPQWRVDPEKGFYRVKEDESDGQDGQG